jgi:thioredoxin 1
VKDRFEGAADTMDAAILFLSPSVRDDPLRTSPDPEGAINMASENVKEFTDQNFQTEVLQSSEPVLVDFWAEWCMPCRMLAPTIEKLAKDYGAKLKVGKVDTDANRDTAMKYGISAIPTVILFKDGQIAQKFIGLRNEKDFKEAIDAVASK